jgi:hypothetical protein
MNMEILAYLYLFFQICLFIIITVIMLNILKKSYKPRNSIVFIALILSLFVINSIFAFFAVNNLISVLKIQWNSSSNISRDF